MWEVDVGIVTCEWMNELSDFNLENESEMKNYRWVMTHESDIEIGIEIWEERED